jgi:hypothetical protein
MSLMNIPDYLPGVPSQYGEKQPWPEYNQGEWIKLLLACPFDFDVTQWTDIEAVVKKNVHADIVLFVGNYNTSLRVQNQQFVLSIPEEVTSGFLPGTYTVAVIGKGSTDRHTKVLAEHGFQLKLSAASPAPKLAYERTVTVLDRDLETGVARVLIVTPEPTVPTPASPT